MQTATPLSKTLEAAEGTDEGRARQANAELLRALPKQLGVRPPKQSVLGAILSGVLAGELLGLSELGGSECDTPVFSLILTSWTTSSNPSSFSTTSLPCLPRRVGALTFCAPCSPRTTGVPASQQLFPSGHCEDNGTLSPCPAPTQPVTRN